MIFIISTFLVGLLLLVLGFLSARRSVMMRLLGTVVGALGLLFVAASQIGFPIVFTNTQLMWLPTQSLYVVRLGVNAPFDAAPLWSQPSTNACSLNSGNGDIGTQNKSANNGCWIAQHPASGIDLRQFGASGSGQTTTTTTIAASPNITLASALDFSNGQGIVIGGAGATPSIGDPTSFTVASNCTSISATGTPTNASKLVTGVSAQGIQVGDVVTGTNIPVSTTVVAYNVDRQILTLSQAATGSPGSVGITIVDPCNLTYNYRIASYDVNGGIRPPLAAVSTAVGPLNLSTANVNCLDWTRPVSNTGLAGYIIWRSTDGGATYHFLQAANIEGAGTCSVGTNGPFWDGGQPASVRPWWVPDNPTTIPGGGQPQFLRTSIVAGAGTTSLVLGTVAQQTITSPTDPAIGIVLHDDSTAFRAWETALNASGGVGIISATSGQPGSNQQAVYRFNDNTNLTRNGIRITSDPLAVLKPFGMPTTYPVWVTGTTGATLTINGNLEENSSCLPLTSIAGLSVGQYLYLHRTAPGGSSEAGDYAFISKISALSCPEIGGTTTAVRLVDSSDVRFPDAGHVETATLTGTPGVGDTVTLTTSGDYVCNATATVLSGDTLTTIARDLAQAVNSTCGTYLEATNSLGVVTITWPRLITSLVWSQSTGHGGGGSEAITLAAGAASTVQVMNPVTGVAIDGLNIDGSDMTGNLPGAYIGLNLFVTAESTFRNLTFANFTNNEQAFQTYYGVNNTYDNVKTVRGSGGTPNINSYADALWAYETNPKINDYSSEDAHSFGPQVYAGQGASINNMHFAQAYYGRGIKLAGAMALRANNLDSANAVFKNLAICCGARHLLLSNVHLRNSYGQNSEGLGTFDAWTKGSFISNLESFNSFYNIEVESTDDISLSNVKIGDGTLPASVGGYFKGVIFSNIAAKVRDINGCELAYTAFPYIGSLSCVKQQGTWSPSLAGSATAGTTTYATQTGEWERDDNQMTVKFSILTSGAIAGAPTGNAIINGLPLVAAGSGGACSLTAIRNVTLDATYTQFTAGILPGALAINLYENKSAAAYANVPVANYGNPVDIRGTCTYTVQ